MGDAERAVVDFVTTVGLGVADAQGFIARLADARALLGRLSALADVREVDRAAVAQLAARVQSAFDGLGAQTLHFLGDPAALDPMRAELDQAEADGLAAPTAATVADVVARVEATGGRAVLLTDVVGGLDVADVTSKTAVLTTLSELLARRNAVRATLDGRSRSLRETESAAGFGAALAVLSQRSTASLLAAPDATAVDGALTELQAELENLELRYGDVAVHAEALDTKRGELNEAFGRRRDQLAGEKARRIDGLVASARRVLATVTERAGVLADRAAVDTFFATDPLVTRVRRSLDELRAVGEAGRAGELEVALGAARDQARRTATDHAELFDEGTVKVGRYRFAVNAEAFALRLDASAEAGFSVRCRGPTWCCRSPMPNWPSSPISPPSPTPRRRRSCPGRCFWPSRPTGWAFSTRPGSPSWPPSGWRTATNWVCTTRTPRRSSPRFALWRTPPGCATAAPSAPWPRPGCPALTGRSRLRAPAERECPAWLRSPNQRAPVGLCSAPGPRRSTRGVGCAGAGGAAGARRP